MNATAPTPASAPAKRGRKSKPHEMRDGTRVEGLYRMPGTDRWRICGTNVTWTEPDERLAVMRFRDWQRARSPGTVRLDAPVPTVAVNGKRAAPRLAALVTFTKALKAGLSAP